MRASSEVKAEREPWVAVNSSGEFGHGAHHGRWTADEYLIAPSEVVRDEVSDEAVMSEGAVIGGDVVFDIGVQPFWWGYLVGVASAGEQANPDVLGRRKVGERNEGGQAYAAADHERLAAAWLKFEAATEWTEHVNLGPDRLIHQPGRAAADGVDQEGDPSAVGFDAAEAERPAQQRIELLGSAAEDVRELAGAGAGSDEGRCVLAPPEALGDARVAPDAGGFDPPRHAGDMRYSSIVRTSNSPRARRRASASARAVSKEVRQGVRVSAAARRM